MIDSIKFSTEVAKSLANSIVKTEKFEAIKGYPLAIGKQALYVMNWQKSELSFTRGIMDMLGYTEAEFTMAFALNCIHPEDLDMVSRVHKGIINLAVNSDIIIQNQYLNITFRLLKKDGMYIRVMRQSLPYQTDKEGRLISNLSVFTDISFLKTKTNLVEWEVFADNMDVSKFKHNIYKAFANFFTPREKEIIYLINNDFTNKRMALQLIISPNTVVAHRKNIFKKSNCKNTKELHKFCELNGINL